VQQEGAAKPGKAKKWLEESGGGDDSFSFFQHGEGVERLLVAFDGSPGAISAIEELKIAGLGKAGEARIIAVADAWSPPEALNSEPELPEFMHETRAHARERAASAAQDAEHVAAEGARLLRGQLPQWTVDAIGRADSPGWAVIEEARRWGATHVAAGAQSHTRLERFFLGSVSQKIVSDAPCSVRISRPRRDHSANVRIIVAYDGSLDAKAAVADVVGREWPAGTQVRIVAVQEGELAEAAGKQSVAEWLKQSLDAAAETLRKQGVEAEFSLVKGGVRRSLLHMAEEWAADVIFVGASGWRHQGRWRVGSVATSLAQRAPCSVEIIRAQRAGGTNAGGAATSHGNAPGTPGVRG